MNKILVYSLFVIGLLVAIGGYFYPKYQLSAGAIGDTQSSPRMAQVVANASSNTSYDSTNNAYIWSSFLNSSATDRVVEGIQVVANGLTTVATSTTATISLKCATSTTATTLGSNTNYTFNTSIATSSSFLQMASSTTGIYGTSGLGGVWKAGSYLNCQAAATTSASVYIKVPYMQE